MTMGVDDGKLAKSDSRRGRVIDDISPPAAAGLAGGGGGEGFGAFGRGLSFPFCCVVLFGSSLPTSELQTSSVHEILADNPLSFRIIDMLRPCLDDVRKNFER